MEHNKDHDLIKDTDGDGETSNNDKMRLDDCRLPGAKRNGLILKGIRDETAAAGSRASFFFERKNLKIMDVRAKEQSNM